MTALLEARRQEIVEACKRRGVSRLDVFGSYLRGDFDPGRSDLDLLVELKPMEPYARVEAYFGLLDDLRNILGHEVDLVMAGAVRNRYIARDIESTRQMLYAA